MPPTLLARCENCVSWGTTPEAGHATASGVGFCRRGLAPEPGALLCGEYQATPRFAQEIISAVLKEEGPMALPVRLVGGKRKGARKNR